MVTHGMVIIYVSDQIYIFGHGGQKPNEIKLLGERIEELRKEKGLTMREFTVLCGISKTQINELGKSGIDFRYSTLIKIAKGLEMSVF